MPKTRNQTEDMGMKKNEIPMETKMSTIRAKTANKPMMTPVHANHLLYSFVLIRET